LSILFKNEKMSGGGFFSYLHKLIQSSSDPAVIEQGAREQGLVAEGERPIRLNGLR